jgi:ATP-dependent DNA helicase RecQ
VREREWDYYSESYKLLQTTIRNSEKECMSEMFYEAYSKVSEFCAGCNAHNEPVVGDSGQFPLKVPIALLERPLSDDQKTLFRDSDELIVYADFQKENNLFKGLIQKRVSCILVPPKKEELIWGRIIEQDAIANILITGYDEAFKLVKSQGFYYIEGIIAIFYADEEEEILEVFRLINRYLRKRNGIKIMHIVKENVFFSSLEKTITELIEGPVTTIEALLS